MAKKNNKTWMLILIIVLIFVVQKLSDDNNNRDTYTQNINNKPVETKETVYKVEPKNWLPESGMEGIDLDKDLLRQNYYIVFDGSGSMDGNKLVTAKKALKEFIKVVPESANLGLLVFDDQGLSERVPLSFDREFLIKEIDEVNANRGTPLHSAISLAYEKLKFQGLKQLGYGEYNLVVVTDGEASGGQDPTGIVNRILKESPVFIHTIGYRIGKKHSLNQPGRIEYKSAENYDELRKGLEDVLAESEDYTVINF
ncbi:MAG: VWA domain-containing protein [Halanaerobiales bacterium]|nr:VWA domain-containing protein [Halanaerobiales bacterium]